MNALQTHADLQTYCRVTCVLYGLSVTITFAEKLHSARDYGPGGWFPWRIFKFDRTHLAAFRRFPGLMDALFGRIGMSIILGAGLAGVATMMSAKVSTAIFASGVATIVIVCLLIQLRSTYGGDGSQQMNLVIGVAILLGFNPWVKPTVGSVSLLFIAAQSCLAYFTSGVSKLLSPVWMCGDPLPAILSTKAYGSELGLYLVLRLRGLRQFAAFSMILLETLFPLSVLLPQWALLGFLLWGVMFHLSNALFMGLNTFVWSFLATYPAVCYAWFLVHD